MKTSTNLLNWSTACLLLLSVVGSSAKSDVVTAPDGVDIHFDRLGQGSPALVFVHGWGNDRSVWSAQADHFAKRYEVVNVDLPGFGASGDNRERFTVASFADDIEAIMRQLDMQQVVLVGFSMGAPVVIEAANRAPKRVLGVVVIDQFHDIDARVASEVSPDAARFLLELVAHPTNEKLMSRGFYTRNPEASFSKIAAMLKDAPRAGWEESLLDTMRWFREESTEAISEIQAPIVAINSDSQPTNVEALRKYAPSFRAKVITDTGHLVMWDAADEFNRLLEETIQELQALNALSGTASQ